MTRSLWGVKSGVSEQKPRWLKKEVDRENTIATKEGWVLYRPHGNTGYRKEVLVSIHGLKEKLGAATITEVRFGAGAYEPGSTRTVRVVFNERVTVTGNPTLKVHASVAGDITATYTETVGLGNVLVFSFTVPVSGNTLTLAEQTISLAGGTVVETAVSPTVNGELVINAEALAGYKTQVVVGDVLAESYDSENYGNQQYDLY